MRGGLVMLQRWKLSLMEGELFCYRGGPLNGGGLVASLTEGEYSCYGGGQFKGGIMVRLWRWQV